VRASPRQGLVVMLTLLPARRISPDLESCVLTLAALPFGPLTLPSVQCAARSALRTLERLAFALGHHTDLPPGRAELRLQAVLDLVKGGLEDR
jgi:hypothetical protein